MSSVQNRGDISTVPFIRSGVSFAKFDQTLAQIIGRATPLKNNTLMGKIAATGKWLPWTAVNPTNGMAIPQGIYQGPDIAAADIAAGDVTGLAIIVGGNLTFDAEQLVIENSLTLATVITVGTQDVRTAEDHLAERGMFAENTTNFDEFENT